MSQDTNVAPTAYGHYEDEISITDLMLKLWPSSMKYSILIRAVHYEPGSLAQRRMPGSKGKTKKRSPFLIRMGFTDTHTYI